MDSVWTAIRLIAPNCYMASNDLKDAYYLVAIAKPYQKYFKREWNNMLFKLTCFPNGFAFCPRKFTKLTKPVFSTLRQLGHLPSSYKESRTFRRCTEWCLKKTHFTNAYAKLRVTPNIDLFASRINCQITPYVSYRADPAAFAINAFHMSWQHHLFYAFPPFSRITRVLQKSQEEKAAGLLFVPKWPTQPRWPKLMQMLIQLLIQLSRDRDTLFLSSSPQEPHPLHKKLCLILCNLSGDTAMAKAIRQQLPESWNNPGGQVLESNMLLSFRNGGATVVQGALIPFAPL